MGLAFWLNLLGVVVAWAAMIGYFLVVVPRWPDLRDSGLPNTVLASVGVLLSAAGLAWCFLHERGRIVAIGLFLAALLPAVFLVLYVHVFSYWLPSTARVIAEGQQAPPVSLLDQDGLRRTLAEFAGKRVVLVFFHGHW